MLWLLFFYCGLACGPLTAQNVTQGKPIISSAAVWPGNPATNVNDGNTASFSHPESAAPVGFYYQIDMGEEFAMHHVKVFNRADGCCPERLVNYRVSLLADNGGVPGVVKWEASMRTNGTNSGVAGLDVLYAGTSTNPAHVFRGRFLRISNIAGAAYNPQLSELQGWVAGPSTNVALGRPVTASGALWPGLDAFRLTDGQYAGSGTISHPNTGVGTGFYYQVDLGAVYNLSRIHVFNRSDCCPDRLSNYRVSLLGESNNTPGGLLWQATIRADGSDSGMGGVDQIVKEASTNPLHQFKGRFIRVENISGYAYSPQVAEIEAFPAPPPNIRYFLTTSGNIGGPGAPTQATLSWNVEDADTVTISGIGNVASTGSQVVTPNVTTTYLLTATRAGDASIDSAVVVGVNAAELPPRLNEFQAADGLLEDEDGDRPDWIEIYNPNPFTLNLQGYSLTDSPASPGKWVVPLVNIRPLGYLVIFASGKDRTAVGSTLHTNFSLAASGEYLGMRNASAGLVAQYPSSYPVPSVYVKQVDRSTMGLDASGLVKYFRPATPGAINGAGSDELVADTVFDVKRGIYTTPQTVAISTATADASIRYTTNGTAPSDTNGTLYTTPITISSTTVLRALAYKAGALPTNVDTHTYLFLADVVTQPTMAATPGPVLNGLVSLPSISVVTPAAIAQDNSVLCSFEYFPKTGLPVQENGGVELYGGEFSNFQKKNFRVSFKSNFGATSISLPGLFEGHGYDWQPVSKFGQLELRSGSHDMLQRGFYMANAFTDATMFEMGSFSVHSRFVHLYLNGTYWGLYHLRERWGAEHHTAYFGGPNSQHESINGNYNVGGWAQPGEIYDGDGSAWLRVQSLRSNFTALKPYLDTPQYIDFMAMWMFGHSEDEYRTTGPAGIGSGLKFMLNDSDGYLSMNPWDANADNTLRTATPPGRAAGDGPGGLLSALYSGGDANYRILLADRLHRSLFGNGALTPQANAQRLQTMCNEVNDAMWAEQARWAAGGESRTYASWNAEKANILQNWLPTRTATYLSQLRTTGYYPTLAAPAFVGGVVAAGTLVSFPVAGASVFYTTDGSDPRLANGTTSPLAQTGHTHAISKNTWLRARAWNGSTWSALNDAFYQVTPLAAGDVVLAEIHYNTLGDDDTEFLELWNPTDHAVNLRGVKFGLGLKFQFPASRDVPMAPGARQVLVSSVYAFQQLYGIDIPIAASYQDRLGNDGDSLTLETAAGMPLQSLHYQDTAPWPQSADGAGYSLTLANSTGFAPGTSSSASNPVNWRTSTVLHGTPGYAETSSLPAGNIHADADHDGLSLLAEWMLGTNAAQPNAPPLQFALDTAGVPAITFQRRLNADNVRLIVECSPDLQLWDPLTTRTEHVNDGNGFASESWQLPENGHRLFYRIQFLAD